MTTLRSLGEGGVGAHTGYVRIVTALLDDHMCRMLLGDAVGAAKSLWEVLWCLHVKRIVVSGGNKVLRAYDPSDKSPVEAGYVYVLPLGGLHIDPWVRVSAWGAAYAENITPLIPNYDKVITRALASVLAPVGAQEAIDIYHRVHRAECQFSCTVYKDVIDRLLVHRNDIPLVNGASPWWLASLVSIAWRQRALADAGLAFMSTPIEGQTTSNGPLEPGSDG